MNEMNNLRTDNLSIKTILTNYINVRNVEQNSV